jgi:hypothetical protein
MFKSTIFFSSDASGNTIATSHEHTRPPLPTHLKRRLIDLRQYAPRPEISQDDVRRFQPPHGGEFCLSPHCTYCLCGECLAPLGEGSHADC